MMLLSAGRRSCMHVHIHTCTPSCNRWIFWWFPPTVFETISVASVAHCRMSAATDCHVAIVLGTRLAMSGFSCHVPPPHPAAQGCDSPRRVAHKAHVTRVAHKAHATERTALMGGTFVSGAAAAKTMAGLPKGSQTRCVRRRASPRAGLPLTPPEHCDHQAHHVPLDPPSRRWFAAN